MPSTNNAAGQNKGATQQINQQTTQAMQRLMQYLGQNPAVPPPGSVTPGAGGGGMMSGAPGMSGGPGMTGQQMPGGGGQQPQAPGGGSGTMNPMQVQQLMSVLMQHKGPGQ